VNTATFDHDLSGRNCIPAHFKAEEQRDRRDFASPNDEYKMFKSSINALT